MGRCGHFRAREVIVIAQREGEREKEERERKGERERSLLGFSPMA
jgi:hypothetical protein